MRLRSTALALLLLAGPAAAADRVVTLAPHLAELVCAVGACERLVGVAEHTDEPGAQRSPRIGNAFAVNAEAVLALRPDLVLAWQGGTAPQLVERLHALRIPVRWIGVRRLDDVATAMIQIGAWLDHGVQAQAAAAGYRSRLAQLREQYRGRAPLRVFYEIEVEPMFTISRRSPIDEAITLCGGVNVFADLPQLSAPVGTEAVLAASPDVIIFSREDMTRQIRSFWKRWPLVRAVAHGQLYEIEASTLARQSPRVLEGVEQLCRTLERARAVYLSPDSM
jgi:iron complex transport system substrate-binding protein